MPTPDIRVLTDLPAACEVLTAAFSTDPGTRELIGDRTEALRRLYDMVVPMMLVNPDAILLGAYDDEGLASVAVCQGPGKDLPLLPMIVRGLPLAWRLGWRRTRMLVRFFRAFEAGSPLRKDQLRLAILGTRPDAFGRGHGAALLQRVDQRARERGLPAVYLEAARDGYPRKLYERHGYRVEKEFDTVAGAIVVMVNSLVDG